ncbi:MAG: nickel pincer cofactor biosynthesis protein LarC [Magnetococcus sp. THC-1_WYH]
MHIHLDPVSGIAGDMFVAACLDLGLDVEELSQALTTLALDPWHLEVSRQRRGGLLGTHIVFHVPQEHHHRHLPDILAIITRSQLPEPVKNDASRIFTLLAEAEGRVHGIDAHHVHFHEVGAMDAILDICAAAFAVWRLHITEITCTPPAVGSGVVRAEHGLMPVPVPAVADLFQRHHVPIQAETDGNPVGELVTPTGAAILVHLMQRFGRFGPCRLSAIDRIGLGLGTREIPGRTNGLRILAQNDPCKQDPLSQDRVTVITTHIDDMNPEWYGLLWDHLFKAGALDVTITPITMKKGRPAVRLEVIATLETADSLARIILAQSTSLGVRLQPCDRLTIPRKDTIIPTPWGELHAKIAHGHAKPEYDDLVQLATRMNWSLPETAAHIARHLPHPDPSSPEVDTPS